MRRKEGFRGRVECCREPFLTCGMCLCRRKTTAEKKAEAARKAEMLQEVDTSAPYSLQQRQPWASKVAEVSFWDAWER